MGRVAVLSQTLINQIAAGEVIVRPASVVKELVENSLDAGSTRITILIRDEGRSIAVIDDGCGMDREDAELALQRHATSKIRTNDDLSRIITRGFRGEAVPSIASVARVEILTRPREALAGTRIVVEGGRIEEMESAGCPPGTRFEVHDLFYNTPARLKFLKNPRVEINALMQIVTQQALSQPEVGWLVEVDGRKVMDVPPGQTIRERASLLWGSAVGEGLFDVAGERHDIKVRGVLGLPRVARRDRRCQIFFVNRRPIVSKTLSAALSEAYRGLLMVNRHPVAALFVDIDNEQVDVNVHPTKEEVRFRNERGVAGSLYRIVERALKESQLVPMLSLGGVPGSVDSLTHGRTEPDEAEEGDGTAGSRSDSGDEVGGRMPPANVPGFFHSTDALARPGAFRKTGPPGTPRPAEQIDWFGAAGGFGMEGPQTTGGHDPSATGRADSGDGGVEIDSDAHGATDVIDGEDRSAVFPSIWADDSGVEPVVLSRASEGDGGRDRDRGCVGPPRSRLTESTGAGSLWDRFGDPLPLGQVAETYVVAAFGQGMLLVDQHAAHERLLFLRLQQENRPTIAQHLLIPITFDVAPADIPQLVAIQPLLRELGIEVEEFGGSTFAINTVPGDMERLDAVGLIQDLLEAASGERGRREPVRELRERIQARMACRAAIKAGQRLSIEEMRRLLLDLRRSRMAFTCPHGRPTMIYLARHELDKQFKRIV